MPNPPRMSDLTPGQRERIALALTDALVPYGRAFDAEDAARLLEARLSVLLYEATADGYTQGHADGREVGRSEAERERNAALRYGDCAMCGTQAWT